MIGKVPAVESTPPGATVTDVRENVRRSSRNQCAAMNALGILPPPSARRSTSTEPALAVPTRLRKTRSGDMAPTQEPPAASKKPLRKSRRVMPILVQGRLSIRHAVLSRDSRDEPTCDLLLTAISIFDSNPHSHRHRGAGKRNFRD